MFERHLFDHYRLFCNERVMIGDFEGFYTENDFYLVVPSDHEELDDISERLEIGQYLTSIGERGIASIVSTTSGGIKGLIDGQEVFLFKLPTHSPTDRNVYDQSSFGMMLAQFHQRGAMYNPEKKKHSNHFGKWKIYWQKRLEQLEQWYEYILAQKYKTEFDELFIMTIPYYIGLTENAIQYVVDSEIDEYSSRMERGTICHKRLSPSTWLSIDEKSELIKLPTDFVYDHQSRDLSEWIRQTVSQEGPSISTITQFLNDYEHMYPLSRFSKRLLYGRLLFPLSYFESIEGYYRSKTDLFQSYYEEQFKWVLAFEEDNIEFLSILAKDLRIPEIDWLLATNK